ncbi:AAA-like domain-containing protein [Microcoleus vaginatus GB1-A2]|uniref:WD40 domain-containing protein n=1 Tax=Microcoleus vaginatus TaxID=119532 RepID=UPI001687485B|nr:AAA-like domain-containing protein [Microcoleus sp. FACHB-61]
MMKEFPVSDEYQIGGSLPADASSYVMRQADLDFYEGLKAREFCYVLNSRQMGKSSLRVRTMQRLQAEGTVCACIDLTGIGKEDVTPEKWYAGMINSLVSSGQLSNQINWRNWWRERRDLLSPLQRFNLFIEEVILVEISQNIVIFIDEIDRVLSMNFSADEFFALIRWFYNRRVDNPLYRKLTFALLGVATPSDLIADKTQTPFNIGKAIHLDGFKFDEVQPLIDGWQGRVANHENAIAQILDWTGGQPFLTQKLCKLVLENELKRVNRRGAEGAERDRQDACSTEEEGVAGLVRLRVVENWESQDEPEHLKTIRDRLLRNQQKAGQLLGLYQQILESANPPQTEENQGFVGVVPPCLPLGVLADGSPEQTELRLSGLVVQQQGKLKVYNRIYAEVFNLEWVEKQLGKLRPYSETFNAWAVANFEDNSRLLRGNALQEALEWSIDKNLSHLDYRFLAASQDLEKREVQQALAVKEEEGQILAKANDTLVSAQQQAKVEFTQAKRRATRIIAMGSVVLGISVITAISIQLQVKKAQQELAQRQVVLQTLFSKAALVSDPFEALLKALQAAQQMKSLEKSATNDTQLQVMRALQQAIYHVRERDRAVGHSSGVRSVTFSPDGKIFASASEDGTVKLWNARPARLISTLTGRTTRVTSVSFHPNGNILASSSEDGTVKLWDVRHSRLIKTINAHNDWIRTVSFSPDGKILASCSHDGTIKLWKTADNTLLKTLKGHTSTVTHISLSPDGKTLASTSWDRTVRLWNIGDGTLVNTLEGHQVNTISVSFSPDGKTLASADQEGIVKLWNVADKTLLQNLPTHRRAVWSAIFSPDGKTLATISSDSTVKLWNLEDINDNRTDPQLLKGHDGKIDSIAFSPDGKTLVSGSYDSAIKLWNLEVREPQTIKGNSDNIRSISFSPDGKIIASGSDDSKIKLWNIRNGTLLQTLNGHQEPMLSVSFSPNGNMLASGSVDKTLKWWNVQDGRLLKTLNDHSGWVRSVRFSPDGKTLASGGDDRTIKLWNVADASLLKTFKEPRIVTDLSFSPDGKALAVACNNGDIRLLNLKTATLTWTFPAHSGWVQTVSFSPNSKILASGGDDGTVKLWNAENGRLLLTLEGHLSEVFTVSFSPDGNILASSSEDGTVRVWNVENGLEISTLEGHLNRVTSVMFSPDGKTIASAGLDNTIKLWNLELDLDNLIGRGCLWLKDYRVTHPEAEIREICRNR